MAKKYEPPKPTGREYVTSTTDFCNYTHDRCDKLPKRWKEALLLPLINLTDEMEQLTRRANRIYINDKNMETNAIITAYQQRIQMLTEALSLFADFDIKFERLMSRIDLGASEKKRLRTILLDIIKEVQTTYPETKELEITVRSHADEMEYISMAGSKYLKLKLTRKQVDYWLKLEQDAYHHIENRIKNDKKLLKNYGS